MSTHTHPSLVTAAVRTSDPHVVRGRPTRFDRWVAAGVQDAIAASRVRLELWDHSSPYNSTEPPIGDLMVHDRQTLVGLAVNPDLWFGERYMSGQLDVRGRLSAIVEALTRTTTPPASWWARARRALSSPNTLRTSRDNVHHHYDLGNEFYQHWLDRDLVYTCAYFDHPDTPLDQAQQAKLDLVCRKLQLRPGDTVVEAGCGWGALALHMARNYDVRIKAFNLSQEQLVFARERATHERLSDRVEFIDDDYRNVRGQFDVFVSVGMLEHVGVASLPAVGDVIRRSLRRDSGRGLLHFIGRDAPCPLNPWIRRRIFPGAYTPTLAEVCEEILVPAAMSVVDVENLRLHYARTLELWAERFELARESVQVAYGEPFARAWELYLAGSRAAFATGWMQLFQVVFAPRETQPALLDPRRDLRGQSRTGQAVNRESERPEP